MVDDQKKIFIEQHGAIGDLPLFFHPWWLDLVAGADNWSVSIAQKDTQIIGAWPYCFKKTWLGVNLFQSELTPYLGPYIFPKEIICDIGAQHAVYKELLSGLPEFSRLQQNCSPQMINWLALYWDGYQQTTRYSYMIDGSKHQQEIWNSLRGSTRREIKKGRDRHNLEIIVSDSCDILFEQISQTYSRQNSVSPLSRNLLDKIISALIANHSGHVLVARSGVVVHAAILIAWDSQTTYYLIGGADQARRTSGALSWLLWNAIEASIFARRTFNFAGSMNPAIERFFRGFGAMAVPYFFISKVNSRLLKSKNALADLWAAVKE